MKDIVLLSYHAKYWTSGLPHWVKPWGLPPFLQSALDQSIWEQFQKFFFVLIEFWEMNSFHIIKVMTGLTLLSLDNKNWFSSGLTWCPWNVPAHIPILSKFNSELAGHPKSNIYSNQDLPRPTSYIFWDHKICSNSGTCRCLLSLLTFSLLWSRGFVRFF